MYYRKGRFLSFVLMFLLLTSAYVGNRYFEISKQLEIFNEVYKEVNMFYVDDVEPKKIMDNAINGMLEKLDPYTVYMNESEAEDMMYKTEGEYGGIGITTKKINNKIYILEIYRDSPLRGMEIKEGDYITHVNGVSLEDKAPDEISTLVSGSPGSEVILKISDGLVEKEFKVKRDNIKLNAIDYYQMIDKEIGYINLSVFNVKALTEFVESFNTLKDKGMKKLIFDLRDNPGGLLDQAIKICNVFVGKDIQIVNTSGKLESLNHIYKTEKEAIDTDIPVIILVNNSSASASEIVSGALQDLDRGVVLGQNTFGKGLVQQLKPLSYGSQIKITTSRYYIPSGRCIQEINYFNKELHSDTKKEFKTKNGRKVYEGKGIKPDVEIKNDPKPLMLIQELIGSNYIFFFVNEYLKNNKIDFSFEKFKLPANIYDKFLKYIEDNNFEFKSKADIVFDKLQEEVKKEGDSEFSKELKKIDLVLEKEKKSYIIKYKDQILSEISKEIIKRKFYREGVIKYNLENNQEIKEAVYILKDDNRYKKILNNI